MYSFTRSSGFRLTLLASALFIFCMSSVAVFIYLDVRDGMEDQLRSQVAAETRQLMGDYADDGLDELRHDISERLERNPGTRLRYTLQSPGGVALFDRVPLPLEGGWSRVEHQEQTLIQLTTSLDEGYLLGVAADTRSIKETAEALRHALLIVIIPMILLAVICGAIMSRRFLSRVERLRQTADSIGKGSLSARMELSGSGDNFDGLIFTINSMLDRIEMLVHEVRHTATNIAHDLRTPLGRLRQRLEIIEADQTDEHLREKVQDATALLDETLETFAAMLTIAELDAGAIGKNREKVDLPALLHRMAEAFEPVASEHGSHITVETDGPQAATVDRALFNQLLSNLIENALRHNAEGICITLSCGHENGHDFVSVRDNGRGIPSGQHDTVIKPFRRLDPSRTAAGSGLGLTLAASIARHHGAELQLVTHSPGLEVRIVFGAN
ncbi:sensor histidine kinase [Henriciella litoralis]|uniref:sensor histidine kinase n=1 Tax=Henriciella litoralis TaxID=568102 RepID=UPI000A00E18C|nr:ATP-binding protein [Henriciella litoralis]